MITPPALKKGDRIGIVTPAGRIPGGALDNAVKCFGDWGLEVVMASGVYSVFNQFGGSDKVRVSGLQAMLDDESVGAVICSRGGYGCVRIVDELEFGSFMNKPKWLVGYSDVTVLHSHINRICGVETIHGPMAAELAPGKKKPVSGRSMELLREALFGTLPAYYLPNHKLSRTGRATGVLAGGNLSVLCSIMGSNSAPDTRGCILFIEEVGEYLYHLDRMMMALKRSGVFESVAGLVVGGMTGMNDNEVPFGETTAEIIARTVSEYDFPVMFGFPAGHQPDNHPLIMGREVTLSVEERTGSITFR
ncbi:MAG: LD-carboxypeptidase [Marinilabiliales bacterium]|nr:MAG: LD-carboxypeptidase [Marinilabiliales bacterium]